MRCQRPLALVLLLTGTYAAAATSGAPDLDALRERARRGECRAVLTEIAPLRKAQPDALDPLLIEANCRLNLATTVSRTFDADAYERMRLGMGSQPMTREQAGAFYRIDRTFDASERDAALALFRRALERDPKRPDLVVGNVAALMQCGRPADAAALLRANKATFDATSAFDLAQVIQDALAARHTAAARELAQAAVAALPDARPVQAAWGMAQLASFDTAGGLAALRRAFPAEPNLAQAQQLALLLFLTGEWNDAVNALAGVAGTSPEAMTWLAIARGKIAPRSALSVWHEVKAQLARMPQPDAMLGRVADHYIVQLQAQDLPTPIVRLRAAKLFAESGMFIPALAETDTALAEQPDMIEALKQRADLLRSRGVFDLALAALDRAAASSSGPATAYPASELQADRGRLLLALGKPADALAAFDKAAAAGAAVSYERGVALVEAGRKEQGIEVLRSVAAQPGENAAPATERLKRLGVTPPAPPTPADPGAPAPAKKD